MNRLFIKLLFSVTVLSAVMIVKANAMTVVLDPGHGGEGLSGSGAIYAPYIEKSLNLEVAEQVYDELMAAGIAVYMTRESDDESLSLDERADIALSYDADLLVSIHFNSSGPHDKSGSEVWTSLYDNGTGREVGNYILDRLSDLGLDNKGVKTKAGNSGDYYGIIRHGTANNIPTIIVEHCFIDHPYDRALLERVGTSAFAHADAEGIIRYVDEYDSLGSACHVLEDLKESEVHPVSESNIVEKLKASVSHIIR